MICAPSGPPLRLMSFMARDKSGARGDTSPRSADAARCCKECRARCLRCAAARCAPAMARGEETSAQQRGACDGAACRADSERKMRVEMRQRGSAAARRREEEKRCMRQRARVASAEAASAKRRAARGGKAQAKSAVRRSAAREQCSARRHGETRSAEMHARASIAAREDAAALMLRVCALFYADDDVC